MEHQQEDLVKSVALDPIRGRSNTPSCSAVTRALSTTSTESRHTLLDNAGS